MPTTDLIGLLDAYFELVGQAIEDHGGEILKFIGDAVLAIFPLGEDTKTGRICYDVLAAPPDALARKAGIPTGVEATAEIDFDIPLPTSGAFASHCGDALDEIGSYPLKGIEKPERVYGLADGGSSSSHATS